MHLSGFQAVRRTNHRFLRQMRVMVQSTVKRQLIFNAGENQWLGLIAQRLVYTAIDLPEEMCQVLIPVVAILANRCGSGCDAFIRSRSRARCGAPLADMIR